jgi:hypothetical protein
MSDLENTDKSSSNHSNQEASETTPENTVAQVEQVSSSKNSNQETTNTGK